MKTELWLASAIRKYIYSPRFVRDSVVIAFEKSRNCIGSLYEFSQFITRNVHELCFGIFILKKITAIGIMEY